MDFCHLCSNSYNQSNSLLDGSSHSLIVEKDLKSVSLTNSSQIRQNQRSNIFISQNKGDINETKTFNRHDKSPNISKKEIIDVKDH